MSRMHQKSHVSLRDFINHYNKDLQIGSVVHKTTLATETKQAHESSSSPSPCRQGRLSPQDSIRSTVHGGTISNTLHLHSMRPQRSILLALPGALGLDCESGRRPRAPSVRAVCLRRDRQCAGLLPQAGLPWRNSTSQWENKLALVASMETITFSTTLLACCVWQLPTVKLPHMPSGFPKLAKTMERITFFSPHLRRASGLASPTTLRIWLSSLDHVPICAGCCADTKVQMLSRFTVRITMSFGFPPCSSKTTIRLFFGFRNDRGTW